MPSEAWSLGGDVELWPEPALPAGAWTWGLQSWARGGSWGGVSLLLTRETEGGTTAQPTAAGALPRPLLFCLHFLILSILIKEMG